MAGLILDAIFAGALEDQLVCEGLLEPVAELSKPDPKLVELCLQSILLYGPAIMFRHPRELSASRRNKLQSLGLCVVENALPNSFPIYKNQNPSREEILFAVAEARHLKSLITPFLRNTLSEHFGEGSAFDILGMSYKKLGPYKTRKVIEALPELRDEHLIARA